jgi:hypothetical protein
MGQSSSRPGMARVNAGEAFGSLQEIVGDWFVDELLFRAPNAEPVVNTGRTMCRSALGGLAVIAINEIVMSRDRAVALFTFNPRDARFEAAIVNSLSDVGIVPYVGRFLMARSSEGIRAQFGKAATAIREWTIAEDFSGEPGITVERIVENKISMDRWVIQFFARGSHGEFLALQQVLTRVQPGCQPQVGCELGCPGLVGCQEGCQGLQAAIRSGR